MLLEAGAEYDIDSGVSRPDLERIHEILKQDPEATKRIRNVEAATGRIFCIARHDEPAACEVLELVLQHGLQVDTEELRKCAKHARDQNSTTLTKIFEEYAARA